MKQSAPSRILMLCAFMLLIFGGTVYGVTVARHTAKQDSADLGQVSYYPGETPYGTPYSTPEETPFGYVSIVGKVVCLPHRVETDIQTMECAYGFQDEAGNYYGLRDSDTSYSNISSAPMNTLVKVEGTLTRETSDTYKGIGTIKMQRITLE